MTSRLNRAWKHLYTPMLQVFHAVVDEWKRVEPTRSKATKTQEGKHNALRAWNDYWGFTNNSNVYERPSYQYADYVDSYTEWMTSSPNMLFSDVSSHEMMLFLQKFSHQYKMMPTKRLIRPFFDNALKQSDIATKVFAALAGIRHIKNKHHTLTWFFEHADHVQKKAFWDQQLFEAQHRWADWTETPVFSDMLNYCVEHTNSNVQVLYDTYATPEYWKKHLFYRLDTDLKDKMFSTIHGLVAHLPPEDIYQWILDYCIQRHAFEDAQASKNSGWSTNSAWSRSALASKEYHLYQEILTHHTAMVTSRITRAHVLFQAYMSPDHRWKDLPLEQQVAKMLGIVGLSDKIKIPEDQLDPIVRSLYQSGIYKHMKVVDIDSLVAHVDSVVAPMPAELSLDL